MLRLLQILYSFPTVSSSSLCLRLILANYDFGMVEGETKKKITERDPFLQYMCSQSHSVLLFFILQFTFLILLFIFSISFLAWFCRDANNLKQPLKKLINRIKKLNGRKYNEEKMWLSTQLLHGTVPLCVLFNFFPCFFDDLVTFTKSLLHFALSIDVPCVSDWFLANHVLSWKQKTALPK